MPLGMPGWPHRADEAEAATLFAVVCAHATPPFSLTLFSLFLLMCDLLSCLYVSPSLGGVSLARLL